LKWWLAQANKQGVNMDIIKNLKVPTGNILIVNGEKGKLELLSLADYGKSVNLSHQKVLHTDLMPLTEKWVITVSTQYGCSMRCSFCDVPKVGPGKNASFNDLINQVITGINLHPSVKSKRLNIHFARMGEPSWNPNVLDASKWIHEHIGPEHEIIHPVVSTMMPLHNEWIKTFIHTWMRIKNRLYRGEAGLQISINSTDENERNKMFSGNAHSLMGISRIMEGIVPYGRKITLNFALANWKIDPRILLEYFSPEFYIVKLTPMHKTKNAILSGIQTSGDYTEFYPYEETEKALKDAGYDVLVFIASREEDESRITCGNAILSDKS
jgi:23S rRNA (adenine2503-C2)-methyltransferase